MPYGADAFDEEQGGIVDNPRRKTQTELNNQIFSLYDFQNQTLFLQKDKDKTFLQEYFKEDIQKDCIIKRFFKTPQEFISNIVRVKKISFTSKTNLFTNEVGLFDNMSDIFGLGQPETFYISMDYKNKPVTENFAGCLESLVARKNNCEFDSLVVIGENDSKIESVFNIESYVESEDINIKTDENGMYNEILVMNSLIAKIKECENV